MKPTQTLPPKYTLAWTVDIKHNLRLNIILNVLGLAWMGLAGLLLTGSVQRLRDDFSISFQMGGSMGNLLITSGLILAAVLAILVVHELVHGLFFWIFSGHKPEFGFGPGYAYAAMPDWFYPKWQYLVVGLSPLVLITAVGLGASVLIPLEWLWVVLIAIIFNAGGAIGDMYVCLRLAREHKKVLIKDTGDGFQLYRQAD